MSFLLPPFVQLGLDATISRPFLAPDSYNDIYRPASREVAIDESAPPRCPLIRVWLLYNAVQFGNLRAFVHDGRGRRLGSDLLPPELQQP